MYENDATLAVVICLFNFIASLSLGSTSFGDGIVLHILWGCGVSLVPAVFTDTSIGDKGVIIVTLMMYIRLITQPLFVMGSLWRSSTGVMNYKVFFVAVVPGTIASVVSVAFVVSLDPSLIRFIFAIGCIFFAIVYGCLRVWTYRHKRRQARLMASGSSAELAPSCIPFKFQTEDGKITILALVGLGFTMILSGVMTTLAGVGGPPLMVYILLFDAPAPICRGTFPLASFVPAVFRFGYVIYKGMYSTHWVPFSFLIVFSGFVGIHLGCHMGNMFTQITFTTFVFVLLVLAAVTMLTEISWILLPALSIGVIVIGVTHFFEHRKAQQRFQRGLTANGDGDVIAQVTAEDTVRGETRQEMETMLVSDPSPTPMSASNMMEDDKSSV